MIVSVSLRITTDDGMPVMLAGEEHLVVQTGGDFEGNVLKAGAALEDAVARARASAKRQIRQTREVDPTLDDRPLGPPDEPA